MIFIKAVVGFILSFAIIVILLGVYSMIMSMMVPALTDLSIQTGIAGKTVHFYDSFNAIGYIIFGLVVAGGCIMFLISPHAIEDERYEYGNYEDKLRKRRF